MLEQVLGKAVLLRGLNKKDFPNSGITEHEGGQARLACCW